jgi:putative phosphoesterase
MVILKQERFSDLSVKKIGLISDTHIPTRAKKIPLRVFDVFQNLDFIIHAGDLVSFEVIEELEQLAPVLAVHGNMDEVNVREKLPEMNELTFDQWRIGVTHDPGALFGRSKMREIAKENKFDVLVYGHTHHQSIIWADNGLFINPGSPTHPLLPFITKPTIAILIFSQKKVEPEIVSLQK